VGTAHRREPVREAVPDDSSNIAYSPDPEGLAICINWSSAARYCNWLSEFTDWGRSPMKAVSMKTGERFSGREKPTCIHSPKAYD
jgi:hypothetical protein